jgi:hypothetical protein
VRWRAAAPLTLALVGAPLLCLTASAQPPVSAGASPASDARDSNLLTSVYDATFLQDLPTSDNLSTVLETIQPSLISDRFSGGGLDAGQPARVGGFGSSWTQTLFRLDGVSFTDPSGSGEPLLFPDLMFWSRVRVGTGLFSADTNAVGLAIDLTPLAPGERWTARAAGSISHSGLSGSGSDGTAPPIVRLDGWDRVSALASGPLAGARIGTLVGVSIARSSQFSRADPFPAHANIASLFSHTTFAPTDRDRVGLVGWLQQRERPLTARAILNEPQATAGYGAGLVQAVWHRDQTLPFHAHASVATRRQTPDYAGATSGVTERLIDGPVEQFAALSRNTVRTWSIGARLAPTVVEGQRLHRFDAGIDVTGGRLESSSFFGGAVGELVHDSPARVWVFDSPSAVSLRHNRVVAAFVGDRILAAPRLTLDVGARFESATGSARGAATGISWQTLLPRASAQWAFSDRWRTIAIAGYSRSAHRLALDYLAVGDPAAPTASVFRWNALAAASLPLSARGAEVARVGPGTGGNPLFSHIDPALRRPTSDELVVGVETHPRDNLLVRLTGVVRTARHLPAVVNVGAPASTAYASFTVAEPGDPTRADDDRVLTVFNRLPASFAQDRYVLTNPIRDNATSEGLELGFQFKTGALTLVGGATAIIDESSAASRGFGPLENDETVLGELFANPNAAPLSRGRLFTDRAFTIKLAGVYELPSDVRVGVVARYQDGQPFSRVVVFPGLNQGAEAVRAFPSGGTRFTFIGTLDVRVQKAIPWRGRRFDALVDVFNLPGMSNSIEEDAAGTLAVRTGTAVQPPRTIHLGLRVTF